MENLQDPITLYYISAVLVAAPMLRLFKRAGFKPYWALLLIVPEAGMILCAAVLASQKWEKA